jgi:hypothetical protein
VLLHQHRGLASLGSMYADEEGAESPQRLEHLGRLDHTGDAHVDEFETASSTRTPHADTAQPVASAAGRAPASATLGRGHKKRGESRGDESGATNGREKRHHPSRSVRHAASGIGRRHGVARRVTRPPLPCQGKGQRGGETGGRSGNGCKGRGEGCAESARDGATSPDDALHACAQALACLMVSMCTRQRVVLFASHHSWLYATACTAVYHAPITPKFRKLPATLMILEHAVCTYLSDLGAPWLVRSSLCVAVCGARALKFEEVGRTRGGWTACADRCRRKVRFQNFLCNSVSFIGNLCCTSASTDLHISCCVGCGV